MISYIEALKILSEKTAGLAAKNTPLLSALGKVSAKDVSSMINVPGFRNSAMDGFAVSAADIASASAEFPVYLPVSGVIAAGDNGNITSGKNAVQIMTGAPVPEGYDAVIPVEEVEAKDNKAAFTRPARKNENIRFPGEDISSGQLVIRQGETVTPEAVMLLSAVGVRSLAVYDVPRLHIISTGNEVSDDPDEVLREGGIYNSNAPYLMARTKTEGLEAVYEGVIRDEQAVFEERIRSLSSRAIIISIGAVSKGSRDFIPSAIKNLGGEICFHRVNIRPGKPILFAVLPNGSLYFGLPGNPISTAIGFSFFVMPLIRMLQGLVVTQPLMAQLAADFTKKGDFRQFLKSRLWVDENGILRAEIADGQESFKILPITLNNSWVVLDESKKEWKAGEIIPVFPYGEWRSSDDSKGREVLICKAA